MKEQRVERILKALEEQGLSQMLIVDPLSIYYLTEYANDPYERFFGLLLRKDGQHVLFLNKLFYAPENSGVKEVWFSDKGFQDFAFFIDQERSRVNLRTERLGGGFIGIKHDGKRQAVFFDVLVYAFQRVYRLGNTEDLEVFSLIVFFNHDIRDGCFIQYALDSEKPY